LQWLWKKKGLSMSIEEKYKSLIEECANKLSVQTVTGKNRGIFAPMINVLLGEEEQSQKELISHIYKLCWGNKAGSIRFMNEKEYSVANAEESCNKLLEQMGIFENYLQVEVVYFWNIMSDNFEQIFEEVKKNVYIGSSTVIYRTFFIFTKENNSKRQELRKERLQRLIEWAKESKEHLIILGNKTMKGVVSDANISENYKIAANLLLIMNSSYETDEERIGSTLHLKIQSDSVFSLAYTGKHKDTLSISAVTLKAILNIYKQEALERHDNNVDIQEKICGNRRTYYDLFDDYFDTYLSDYLPKDIEFFNILPYTEEMENLDTALANKDKKGLFSFVFKKHTVMDYMNLAKNAVDSISGSDINKGVWECVLEKYYENVFENKYNKNAPSKSIEEFFSDIISEKLTYIEIRDLLGSEADRLKEEENIKDSSILPDTFEGWLEWCAIKKLKENLYKKFIVILQSTMKDMVKFAIDFENVLNQADSLISEESISEAFIKSYQNLAFETIKQFPEILNKNIRPTNLEELANQLTKVFSELILNNRIYSASYQEDLDFQMGHAHSVTVRDIIDEVFDVNLASCSRMLLYGGAREGIVMTMISKSADFLNNLPDTVKPTLGYVFASPRSDVIERIMLFPITLDSIMW